MKLPYYDLILNNRFLNIRKIPNFNFQLNIKMIIEIKLKDKLVIHLNV
jgi:hypothetical protein